jgi:hypothetical protein
MQGAIPPLPQYVFMAWCLVKCRDNFTFTLRLWIDLHIMLFFCRGLLDSVGVGNWWTFSVPHNVAPSISANVEGTGNRLENVEPGKTFLISDATFNMIFQTLTN